MFGCEVSTITKESSLGKKGKKEGDRGSVGTDDVRTRAVERSQGGSDHGVMRVRV